MNLSRKVLDSGRKLGAVLLLHANAIAFFAGFGLFGYGVAAWSPPAAYVALGSVLMIVAAWPYLHIPRKKT